MKGKSALSVAAVTLLLITSCGLGEPEQPSFDLPVASEPQPAATTDGYEIIEVVDGGSIGGMITLSGPIPELPPRRLNKDPEVCGTGERDSQQLIVSGAGGLQNAVVIVENVTRGKAMPASAQTPQIDQRNCEYLPHVQVAPVNSEIAIINSDPTLHNFHFYQGDESLLNIAQPIQGQINTQRLESVGLVYVECDVHGWMQAHVVVVDSPYFAVTDENGRFSIADLPAGMYTVKVWHEYLGERTENVTVVGDAETELNLDLEDLLAERNPPVITAVPDVSAGDQPGDAVVITLHSAESSFVFEPADITIKAGTTATWLNISDNRHSVTADPMFEKEPGQAVLPAGAEPWSSAFLRNGETFSRTFTVPGTYQYFCRNHEQYGMVATITVVP